MCLVWALCESTYVDINKTTDIILVLVWIEFHFNLFVIIKSITVTYLFREKPRNSALSLSLTVTSALQRIGELWSHHI